jgi:hypothetical protein
MGGGHIECGEFLGEDKSGSQAEIVLELLFRRAAGRPPYSRRALLARLLGRRTSLSPWLSELELVLCDRAEVQEIRLPSTVADGLLPHALKYHDELGRQLGYPQPEDAPELDYGAGVDPIAAKWQVGLGWRYYCTNDLVQALQRSTSTREPVIITFD